MNFAFRWKWSTNFNVWISTKHTIPILMLADDAFKTRPLLFAPIYILFGYFENFLISCVCCLTSKQDQVAYEKIFNHVLSIGLSHVNFKFSPEVRTCDFEFGSINAATSIFPQIDITACGEKSKTCNSINLLIHQRTKQIPVSRKKKFAMLTTGFQELLV